MFKHAIDILDNIYVQKNGNTHLTKDLTDIEMHGYAGIQ
jgi:hypothetical protein